MKQIASFQINHDTLVEGMYRSRVDGDITTFDLRFVRPNTPPYLETPAMHTIEHLFATYVRSSCYEENIIYFGPMGCRTGFYFLTRDLEDDKVIALTKEAMAFISTFEGEIPGATKKECGNYLEHDLRKAREYAALMCEVLALWTPENLQYLP